MKKLLLILISLKLSLFLSGQITFEKTFGGISGDYGYSVIQTNDGGYLVCGNTYSYGAGGGDIYIIKTDEYGDTLWTKTYGGPLYDAGCSVIQNENNEYIICGGTYIDGSNNTNIYLLSIDTVGDTLWTKKYGGTYKEWGTSIIETIDGGYLITGRITFSDYDSDVLLIRTNIVGDTLWTKKFGYDGLEKGNQSIQTNDNGFISLGITMSFSYLVNIYLNKTDELGDTLWTKVFGNYFITDGTSITKTSDDGFLIVGSCSDGGPFPEYDIYMVKIDQNGSVLWSKTYGTLSHDEFASFVQMTSDNGFIITGRQTYGCNNLLLIKTDMNGNNLWTRYFSGNGKCVKQTNDNGFIVTGENENGNNGNDVYLIKTNEDGIVTSTEEILLSNRIKLYPNPVDDFITIEYPESRRITLMIYNTLGKVVLQNSREEDIFRINLSNYNSGVYFIKIETEDKVVVRKIIKN